MSKVKILVVHHKKTNYVYSDDVYTPIHAGKALHPELDLGFIGDDTGENISLLNPYYCELTAQYWAWKNLECEYIGLCHYRRYFKTKITNDNIDDLMKGCDALLAKPNIYLRNVLTDLKNVHTPEDILLFMNILEKQFPEEYITVKRFLLGNKFYPFNMFVMKKTTFDEFAQWQFKILDEVFHTIPRSPHANQRRLMGYLGEVLLPIYFLHHHKKIKTLPVVTSMEKDAKMVTTSLWTRCVRRIQFKLHHKSKRLFRECTYRSLEADGYM